MPAVTYDGVAAPPAAAVVAAAGAGAGAGAPDRCVAAATVADQQFRGLVAAARRRQQLLPSHPQVHFTYVMSSRHPMNY